MYSDGQSEPVEKPRQRILNLQNPNRQERDRAKQHAESEGDNERSHRDEELPLETLGLTVNDITRGVGELKILHFQDGRFEHPTEEGMGCLMDDHSGERNYRDDKSWDKEHQFFPSFA